MKGEVKIDTQNLSIQLVTILFSRANCPSQLSSKQEQEVRETRDFEMNSAKMDKKAVKLKL